MQADRRSKRVWERLIQAYGSRVADMYGPDVPQPWQDAIDDLTDEQIAYGLRQVVRESLHHPPTLGLFIKSCNDAPIAGQIKGPSIQEQLCAYVTLKLYLGISTRQQLMPWTYLYREWIDADRPKHSQKCNECMGVEIEPDGDHPGHRVMVVDMLADIERHRKALKSFEPGRGPKRWVTAPDLRV